MPKFEVHCEDCVRVMGEPFEEVHRWLDEYVPVFGTAHRDVRHHEWGVERVRQMWGDRAAKAAEIHIEADSLGEVPTIHQARLWSMFHKGASDALEKEFPFPIKQGS
jgi:hypothetical protein